MVALLGLAALAACSSATIKRATPSDEGIRFYRPHPYLLVSLIEIEGEGEQLKSEVLWLPDYSHEYVVTPKGWFGKSDMTVQLQDGWALTQLTLSRDSQVPETAEKISTAIASLVPLLGREVRGLEPGLYRLDVDSTSVFASLTRLEPK